VKSKKDDSLLERKSSFFKVLMKVSIFRHKVQKK